MLSTSPPPRRLHGISLGHAKNPLFCSQPPLNIGPDLAITSMGQKGLIPGAMCTVLACFCMSLRAELVFSCSYAPWQHSMLGLRCQAATRNKLVGQACRFSSRPSRRRAGVGENFFCRQWV